MADADGNTINADRTVKYVQGGQISSDVLAIKSELPTKTSELSNDSSFVTTSELSTQLAIKRDLTDLHVATNPQVDNGAIWVDISGSGIAERISCAYDGGSGWTGDGYIRESYPLHLEIMPIDENIYNLRMAIDTEDFQSQITLSPPTYTQTITFASCILGDLSLAIFPLGTNLATETYAVQNNGGVAKVQSISESDYDALGTPDPATLYVILEET